MAKTHDADVSIFVISPMNIFRVYNAIKLS